MAATQKPLSFSLGPLNTKYILDLVAAQKLVNSRYTRSIYMDDLITHLRTKAEDKEQSIVKKILLPAIASLIPEGLNTEAWGSWVEFRKKAKFKKYKTDAAMKKLAKMGDFDEQALIVQNSIDLEYQGLFPLKANNKTANQNILQDSSDSDWHLKEDKGF